MHSWYDGEDHILHILQINYAFLSAVTSSEGRREGDKDKSRWEGGREGGIEKCFHFYCIQLKKRCSF